MVPSGAKVEAPIRFPNDRYAQKVLAINIQKKANETIRISTEKLNNKAKGAHHPKYNKPDIRPVRSLKIIRKCSNRTWMI